MDHKEMMKVKLVDNNNNNDNDNDNNSNDDHDKQNVCLFQAVFAEHCRVAGPANASARA
jgi:hypothetical protein